MSDQPAHRFIVEGDAEYGVFKEPPHFQWWCEGEGGVGSVEGWHSHRHRQGDLLVQALAVELAHVAGLLAASRERIAALESAMNEALLLIERAAVEVEYDAKVGERHDATAELWSLHRTLMADGPWPRLANLDRLRREVCEAAREAISAEDGPSGRNYMYLGGGSRKLGEALDALAAVLGEEATDGE